MLAPPSNRLNMTYTNEETRTLVPLEIMACRELGIRRSELHKRAFREFWNNRQTSKLKLI